jgi:pimeloyl-ACP methyl ester carboxylesterase
MSSTATSSGCWTTELFIPRIFAGGGPARERGLLQRALAVARRSDPPSMARIWAEMVEQDFRADLERIRLPTLVTSGARSQLYGLPASDWIVRKMPAATQALFGDSGHAPHLEEPAAFNHMLAAFAAGGDWHESKEAAQRQP